MDWSAAEGNIEDKSAEALKNEYIVNDRKQVNEIVIENNHLLIEAGLSKGRICHRV